MFIDVTSVILHGWLILWHEGRSARKNFSFEIHWGWPKWMGYSLKFPASNEVCEEFLDGPVRTLGIRMTRNWESRKATSWPGYCAIFELCNVVMKLYVSFFAAQETVGLLNLLKTELTGYNGKHFYWKCCRLLAVEYCSLAVEQCTGGVSIGKDWNHGLHEAGPTSCVYWEENSTYRGAVFVCRIICNSCVCYYNETLIWNRSRIGLSCSV